MPDTVPTPERWILPVMQGPPAVNVYDVRRVTVNAWSKADALRALAQWIDETGASVDDVGTLTYHTLGHTASVNYRLPRS